MPDPEPASNPSPFPDPFSPPTSAWELWQVLDATFPTGGFAHSAGLEAAAQHGEVRDADDLRSFLLTGIAQCRRSTLLVALAARHDPDAWPGLDPFCEAMLTNHVARRASRSQGHAFLIAIEQTTALPAFTSMRAALRDPASLGHFPVMFGACAGRLGWTAGDAAAVFLFMGTRGVVSAAVRLGLVGPFKAQALQWQLRDALAAAAAGALAIPAGQWLDEVAGVAPVMDILHGCHDRLYSRLFQT